MDKDALLVDITPSQKPVIEPSSWVEPCGRKQLDDLFKTQILW